MPDQIEVAQERLNAISALVDAIRPVWPTVCKELERMREGRIESLIASENEQTRGRILQLNDLKRLPDALLQEQTALKNALPE